MRKQLCALYCGTKQDFIKRAADYFHTAGTTGFLEDQTPEEKRKIVRELLKKAGAKVKPE